MTQLSTDSGLRLLPRNALVKTGDVDHADWNFRPLLGQIQRLRFRLVRKLLKGQHAARLLDIGYGSGVFMPELDKYCDDLYGIDPHPHADEVAKVLGEHNVWAHLVSGTAEVMPYPDDQFDVMVVVSALEFIPDLQHACIEMRRVLAPGGKLIVITPGRSPVVDFGLKVLTGKSADKDFGDRRNAILPTLMSNFEIDRRIDFPPLTGGLVRLYTALRLIDPKKKAIPPRPSIRPEQSTSNVSKDKAAQTR